MATVLHRSKHDDDVLRPDASGALTIVDIFRDDVKQLAEKPALRRTADGRRWDVLTWAEYGDAVERAAAGLLSLGVDAGDRVAILSANRVEWQVADVAILSVGAVSVPIYATSAGGQVAYQLRHSASKVCFVEDSWQLAKVLLHRAELPDLEHVVVFATADGLDDEVILAMGALQEAGGALLEADHDAVERRRRAIESSDLATIVYTSGTTGPPKGVMLTHSNLMAALRSITEVVDVGPHDRFLSFLPLSHIAERSISHCGQIASGGEVWFARNLASVPEDLLACRPTLFFAVPRVWEKLREAIVTQIRTRPQPLPAMFDRLVELGLRTVAGDRMSPADRLVHLALDRSLGALLRHRLGLDRARLLVSGAAPIHPDLLRWFHAIGLPVAEGYGQTEDVAAATLNPAGAVRIGTVGVAFPRVELRIADDGEVLVRGGTVCLGYYRDESATDALVDADGWMHTGDLGCLDDDGYLAITGRKKDLIITSSGKNIGPEQIETDLRQIPLVSQAVVVGDGRPYLVALLTLDAEAAARWAERSGRMVSLEALAGDPDVLAEVADGVAAANARRSPIEQVKRWRILPHELTLAGGELTPTLKIKRSVVTAKYADVVDELYAS